MQNILLITSSGGGGLLQSAIAIEQEEKKIKSDTFVTKRDILVDWAIFGLGRFFKNFYNFTQINGKVKIQSILVSSNIIADYILYPFIFFGTLYNLFKKKIDRVIDNQPISPAAVILAIRIYNRVRKKNVILEKVFVDLPNKRYKQFLKCIKNLSKKNKKFINLFSVEPLLEENQKNKDFWKKYCNISEEKVFYKYSLRDGFYKYENLLKPNDDYTISLKTSYLEEKKLINKCLEKGNANYKIDGKDFKFVIKKNDKLIVILLGSQPSSNGTYNYIKNFIDILKSKKENYYIFTFCNKFTNRKKTLFKDICSLVEEIVDFPSNINVIPMSFQTEDVIASLFHRSDITITRSGGQTIMELIKVGKGKKFIHSESDFKGKDFEKLLKGIPFWEAGNACYFKKKDNGKLISPNILSEYFS